MHRQILYLSHLVTETGHVRLSEITLRAAVRNQHEGIHAALLFDGYRFCQLFEGPVAAADALWQRLQADRRHHQLKLLSDQSFSDKDQATSWSLGQWVTGYCDALEFDAFEDAAPPMGQGALQRFHAIVRRADLRP